MREHARLDVGVDMEFAAQAVEQPKGRVGERNVELDVEGRRAQDHATDLWRIVVCPGRRQDTAHALADDSHGFKRDTVGGRNVARESVEVPYQRAKIGRVAGGSRSSMTAGVPGEHGKVREVKFLHNVLHPPGMFVPAVKENDRWGWRVPRGPITVEQPGSVVGVEVALLHA